MKLDDLQIKLFELIIKNRDNFDAISLEYNNCVDIIKELKTEIFEDDYRILYSLMIDSYEFFPSETESINRKNIVIGMHFNSKLDNISLDLSDDNKFDNALYSRIDKFNENASNVSDELLKNQYVAFGIGLSLTKMRNEKGKIR